MSAATRQFLAWVREGAARSVGSADPLTGTLPARELLQVGVTINTRPEVAVDLEVYGPGDITGLDARQIVGTMPKPFANDYEPNLFAHVDLDRPDLPWLFTPAQPDAQGRLRPWLCLVVVERKEGTTIEGATSDSLPKLTCSRDELPNLDESWAWAHAQVALADNEQLDTVLAKKPERTVSRLICPRKLKPMTPYYACVVPVWEAGRRAGLKLEIRAQDEQTLVYAWSFAQGAPATVELPVYFQWEFETGVEGDFESLVQRLQPRALPNTIGLRSMYVGAAGLGLPQVADGQPGSRLGLEGALRAPPTQPTPWPQTQRTAYEAGLTKVLAGAQNGVVPPLYGSGQAGVAALPGAAQPPRWLRELNLDPRHRAAASFGARVVRDQQEALMASAWRQVDEVERLNRLLRQAQLARAVSQRVYEKRLEPRGDLTDIRVLGVTELLHSNILLDPEGPVTAWSKLREQIVLPRILSAPFRQLVRPLGPLARRLGADIAQPLETIVDEVALGDVVAVSPREAPEGIVRLDEIAGSLVDYNSITRGMVESAPTWWKLSGGPAGFGGIHIVDAAGSGIYSVVDTETTAPERFVRSDEAPVRIATTPLTRREGVFRDRRPGGPRPIDFDTDTDVGPPAEEPGAPAAEAGEVASASYALNAANETNGGNGDGGNGGGGPVYGGGMGTETAVPAPHARWTTPLGFLSNMVTVHVDNPAGGNFAYPRVGRALDFEGNVTEGWNLSPAMPFSIGNETQGAGVAVADVSGNGQPDLIVAWIDNPAGANRAYYRIGWNLDAQGNITGGWSPARQFPAATGDETLGADIAVCDIDGNGKLDLIFCHVHRAGTSAHLRWQIAWGLQADGSAQIFGPVRDGGTWSANVQGLGISVADIDGDLRPELVVFWIEDLPGNNQGYYKIGWQLNRRGRVVGGWSPAKAVLTSALFGTSNQGAGIAIADMDGSGKPDLFIFHVDNTGTDNTGWYKIGWDLDASGQPTRGWSQNKQVPGWWGWENQGAALAIADVDPALANARAQMGDRFRAASALHQAYLLGPGAQPGPVATLAPIDAHAVAQSVYAALDPSKTLIARVEARTDGTDAGDAIATTPSDGDPLRDVLAAPRFPQPMYEPLRDLSQELLLPGVEGIEPDTVSLLEPNEKFIESYMVGLNDELSRELRWREYPSDGRGTYFRQFWDPRSAAAGAPQQGEDIPPIHEWDGTVALGDNATGVGGAGMLILLVRGQLLARYPRTLVYARKAKWVGTGPQRDLDAEEVRPSFRGTLQPDITFFGFPFSEDDARGVGGDAGYFFVLQEEPTGARFGLDALDSPPQYGGQPATWNALHWGNLAADQAAYDALVHVSPAGALAGHTVAGVEWGRNSAHLANITLQQPFQIAIHADDMLP